MAAREQVRALDREAGQRERETTNREPFCWTETQVCADTCIFVLLRESPRIRIWKMKKKTWKSNQHREQRAAGRWQRDSLKG